MLKMCICLVNTSFQLIGVSESNNLVISLDITFFKIPIAFQKVRPILHSHQQLLTVSVGPHPHQSMVLAVFCFSVILASVF